jgi:hypothetical protein
MLFAHIFLNLKENQLKPNEHNFSCSASSSTTNDLITGDIPRALQN